MDLEKNELRKKHRRARKMMLLFSLLSITMTFAGLTSAYIVSKARPDWLKDFELPDYFIISTLIILASSITMWLAKKNVKKKLVSKTSFWIAITFLLSIFFFLSQFLGFQELINKGYYFTGDGCRRDADGYYWITGRVDDVINVSGHRMGTAEVESALVAHPKVAEAAVVGYPHEIKGQGIYCYVTLMSGEEPSDELRVELRNWVRKEIGPIASPDLLQWAPGLPKTRSGKIMRRILRKVAEDDFATLGDTSTLADPSVVDDLIENRMNRS